MPSGEDVSLLADRVASVGRRLSLRAAALGASAGALAAVGAIAAFEPGPALALVVAAAFALAAAAASLRFHRRSGAIDGVRWLDRRTGDVDLVTSAVAVVDGRARPTALAGAVVGSAAARARDTDRPSQLPLVFGTMILALVTAVAWIASSRDALPSGASPVQLSSERRVSDPRNPSTRVVVAGGSGAAAHRSDASSGHSAGSDLLGADLVGDRDVAGASGGASAGDDASDASGAGASGAGAARDPDLGDRVAPRAAAGQLVTAVPPAGAAAELAAVPPRYRALVAAYVGAR